MQLTVTLGAIVTATVDGHSAVNGATIPEGATVTFTSNDPTIATVPADPTTVPAGGATTLSVPVTVLASGSTDIHVKVDAQNAGVFEDIATLIVAPAVEGLTHVTLTLTSP